MSLYKMDVITRCFPPGIELVNVKCKILLKHTKESQMPLCMSTVEES